MTPGRMVRYAIPATGAAQEGITMITFAAIALTCWLCALLAIPGRPVAHDEGQELVYRRLIGRQQWLVAYAILATAAAVIALLWEVV